MSREKTARMANQIASFFASQPGDRAAGVAKHINDFWEPRMRAELLDIANSDRAGLEDLVKEALPQIRRPPKG